MLVEVLPLQLVKANAKPDDTINFDLHSAVTARGRSALCYKFCSFSRAQQTKFLHQSCFSKRIDLASNVFYGIAKMDFLTTIWLLRSL